MKIFKNGKVYVQLKDLSFLFKEGGYLIPHSVYKKALKRVLDMNGSEKDDFIEFIDDKEIEFFKSVKYIVDFNEQNSMSTKEYNDFVLSSYNKLLDIRDKAKNSSKLLEYLNYKNKFKKESYRITGIREIDLIKKGKRSIELPIDYEIKKKKLFNRRNG